MSDTPKPVADAKPAAADKPSEPTFKPAASASTEAKSAETKPAEAKPTIGEIFKKGAMPMEAVTAKPAPVDEPKADAVPATEPTPASTEPTVPAEPKKKTSLKSQDFDALKASRDEALKRADEAAQNAQQLATRIKEMEVQLQSLNPAAYEETKKQNAQLMTELEKLAVERSPRFQQAFDAKINVSVDKIKQVITGIEGISPEAIAKVVKSPDSPERTEQLNDLLAQLTPVQQSKVGAALEAYEATVDERSRALEDHKKWISQQQEQQQQMTKEQEKKFASIIDNTLEAAAELVPYLKKVDGNEEHNARVDAFMSEAREVWLKPQSHERLAEVTVGGILAPRIFQHASELYQENVKLQKELATLKQATSVVRTGEAAAPTAKKSITELFKTAAGHSS